MSIHAFGDFELDERLYELRRGGTVVKLEPKVFDVVAYLVRHPARVVSKDELLDRLWPGEHVSESVLPRCITLARRALGDDPSAQRVIQTVHGRGYRFVAVLRSAGDTETPPPSEDDGAHTIFVGREAAMAALCTALADAAAGRGRLALLVGEPGIGKTRTAAELASAARAAGAIVLVGRCHEGEGAPAFWPWVQIVRAATGVLGAPVVAGALGPAAADVAALVPELASGVGSIPASSTLTPEQARFRLFDGITGLFVAAARERPIVVVLDDLHWADKPSLLLLQFLVRQMRESRLLVIAAYRDVALRRSHPLAEALGELAREPHQQRIALRGLERDDVARFVDAAAGRPAPSSLVEAVHAMTDGNPFFVGEIVRLLIAEGRLDRPADAGGIGVALPESVRQVIGRRLNVLSDACNELLGIAAVLGRAFELPVLERVAELPGERVLELLDEAVTARVLIPHAADAVRYAFTHALVRETLYEELSTPLRVRLHRRAGLVLEARHGTPTDAPVAEIAHHFFEGAPGGDVAAALAHGERAAARALACLAYEEAAGHYERCLQALELAVPIDEERRVELLLARGDAEARAGERTRARATFQAAAAAARPLRRSDLLARAALGFGGRSEFGLPLDPPLVVLLEEARDALGTNDDALGTNDDALRVRVQSRLVGTAPYSDSLATRRDLSREAVETARRLGDPGALVVALGARVWALLGPDHVEERLAIATELVELAAATGDRNTALLAHEMRFDATLALGDMEAADAAIAAMASVAEELRQPVERFFVASIRAGRALSDGRYDEADRLIGEAQALAERAGHPAGTQLTVGHRLFLAHERGEIEAMDAALRSFVAIYPWASRMHHVGRTLMHCELGRFDEARREFEPLAAADFADLPRDEHWMITVAQLATVCADLGDRRHAAVLAELLAPFASRNAVHDLLRIHGGAVAHYLARLEATGEHWSAAIDYFEQALDLNRRRGALPALTRTRHEYARMLTRRGHRRDLPRARTLVAEVLAASEALGFARLRDEATRLAAAIPHEIIKKSVRT